jgi:hypothetical protein
VKPPKKNGNSLALETRRLLRHLDTPDLLRHNVLVAHLFDEYSPDAALATIRSIVHRALDRLVEQARYAKRDRAIRHRTIVMRYDLGGEPACAVAADLGLSMRHFYRERHAACIDIGTLLKQIVPARARAHYVASVYEVAESAAHAIYLSGAPERAAEQFLTLARAHDDPLSRIAALCDAAMIHIELYDNEGARQLVASAIAEFERADMLPATRAEAQSLIGFAQALGLWDAADGVEAVGLARHTMQSAQRYMGELSASGLRLQAGERMRYASRALTTGDPIGALKLLRESEPFIDLLGQRVPYLRVDYANIRCGVELRGGGDWEQATQLATTAYEESRKQGYLVGAATSAKALAYMLATNGDARSLELAEAVVDLARCNNSPRLLAYAQIGAAEIYSLMNRFAKALELTRSAADALHGESLQLERLKAVEARALHGLKKLPRS